LSETNSHKVTAEQPTAEAAEVSFESAVASLEKVVRELEEGQIGLSDALARYERGVTLLGQCQAILERAERRIELLTGVDGAGRPRTEPLDDTQSSTEQKQQGRRLRRGGPADEQTGEPSERSSIPGAAAQPVGEQRRRTPASSEIAQSKVDEPPFAL
jgi:exodeoxyribonuclease VII small subunit